MKNIRQRYRDFCIRQCSTAACSPGLIVIGMLVAIAIICYMYRQVILQTLEVVGVGMIVIGALGAGAAVARLALRGRRRPRDLPAAVTLSKAKAEFTAADLRAFPTAEQAIRSAPIPRSDIGADPAAITEIADEAAWLEDAGTELAFDEHGNLRQVAGS
jgi:hypothetical protein